MKKIAFLLFLSGLTYYGISQGVAINQTNTPADGSSMLDISSHTRGVLLTRLRTIERTGISAPVTGLFTYDTDTRSFWYFDGGWHQVLNDMSSITPMGPALGDLSGTYPAPTVSKIQNLGVAFGVPFDKQVLKWDGLNNQWSGQNDSLFLPYNATFGSSSKLFGVTNTNSTNGATAVYGKSGAGSGITPALTIGVWGDNANGAGVLGTGNNGTGVYGYSINNYGVYGYTAGLNYAGVYGSNANAGTGILGEVYSGGIGMFGKSNGTAGKAAVFQNLNANNTDTAVNILHNGTGMGMNLSLPNVSGSGTGMNISVSGSGLAIYGVSNMGPGAFFQTSNVSNPNPAITAAGLGTGPGISVAMFGSSSPANGININLQGTGNGMVITLPNASNNSTGIQVIHSGTGNGIYSSVVSGRGLWTQNTSITTNTELFYANNVGLGHTGKFTTTNSSNSSSGVYISTNGTGRGVEAIISNSSSAAAAVYASSSGSSGIQAYAQGTAILGQATTTTGGVGVFGQSSLNSADGIGVKGISYSTVNNSGAVTGLNNSDGIGVYGYSASVSGNGIGVYGSSSGANGIGVYGISNTPTSPFSAAVVGENTGGGNGIYGHSAGNSATGIVGLAEPGGGNFGVGVVGQSYTYGDGLRGFGAGAGNGVTGYSDNANSSGNGVYGETDNGTGYGVKGVSYISSRAAILGLNYGGDGVAGTSNGTGNGVSGIASTSGVGIYGSSNPISSTGGAALFVIPASSNTAQAVVINSSGKGEALYLKRTNGSPNNTLIIADKQDATDFLLFEDSYGVGHKVRIDAIGKGFFNGGTQSSGADMAEAFDVNGNRKDYEPGDILVIATDKDRTVEKSAEPYSTLVAGVYATKPGVLMTEENIDADLSSKVPMGVVGVIPTKVCGEGGEIKRGDMLVTSSIPGVAMKADPGKIKPGQTIGKALENFSALGIGKIRVLVNVK